MVPFFVPQTFVGPQVIMFPVKAAGLEEVLETLKEHKAVLISVNLSPFGKRFSSFFWLLLL